MLWLNYLGKPKALLFIPNVETIYYKSDYLPKCRGVLWHLKAMPYSPEGYNLDIDNQNLLVLLSLPAKIEGVTTACQGNAF